jgi:Uma2 family endonuclease
MGEAAPRIKMSPEEYLAFERASDEKHEYVDGEIFAMSGGTNEHSLLGSSIVRELGIALLDRPCYVHTSDMRIKVAASNRFFYPDVSVVYGAQVFGDEVRDSVLNPKVIVEVLSDSTERYDRGEKFAHYRRVESLQEYVLASQKEPLVEHYSRQADGVWLYRALGPGEQLVLPSLGCAIAVDRIYLKVFPSSGDAGQL